MGIISVIPSSGVANASPAKPTEASVQAPRADAQSGTTPSVVSYPSPVFSIDPQSNRVLVEFRDVKTGVVTQQIPPKDAAQLYQRTADSV